MYVVCSYMEHIMYPVQPARLKNGKKDYYYYYIFATQKSLHCFDILGSCGLMVQDL